MGGAADRATAAGQPKREPHAREGWQASLAWWGQCGANGQTEVAGMSSTAQGDAGVVPKSGGNMGAGTECFWVGRLCTAAWAAKPGRTT